MSGDCYLTSNRRSAAVVRVDIGIETTASNSVQTQQECQQLCEMHAGCCGFVYTQTSSSCSLKSEIGNKIMAKGSISCLSNRIGTDKVGPTTGNTGVLLHESEKENATGVRSWYGGKNDFTFSAFVTPNEARDTTVSTTDEMAPAFRGRPRFLGCGSASGSHVLSVPLTSRGIDTCFDRCKQNNYLYAGFS